MATCMYNVVLLGFAFMLVFTAFQTGGLIQKVVLTSIRNEDPTYKGDGYYSLSVIYFVFAIFNWLAPSIISLIGPRLCMFISAITYNLFIAQFLFPVTWGLYAASVLIGMGAAVIWTAQGTFLTQNSDSTTMSRNSGIFWAMMQTSLVWGNIFVYIKFMGKDHIDKETRTVVFGVLTVVGCIGMVFMLFFKKPPSENVVSTEERPPFVQGIVDSFRLFKTRDMFMLCFVFFYTGLELSFFSGVYGSALAFTRQLGTDASKWIALNGLLIGAGEVLSGLAFSILGSRTIKYGRDPVVILGFVVHLVTFFTIFINLPANSPLDYTDDSAYIQSNVILALAGSFCLGFGDGCFNTQIYSLLGSLYSSNSAPAFALFKFTQSIAAAIAFFYSNQILLPFQLLILVIMGIMGTVGFCKVEWRAAKAEREKQESTSMRPGESTVTVSTVKEFPDPSV